MRYLFNNPAKVLALTGQHLRITFVALAIAIVIALPLGGDPGAPTVPARIRAEAYNDTPRTKILK